MCGRNLDSLEELLDSTFIGGDLMKTAELYFDRDRERSSEHRALWLEVLAASPRNKSIRRIIEESHSESIKIVASFLEKLKRAGAVKRDLDANTVATMLVMMYDGVLVSLLQGVSKRNAKAAWLTGVRSLLESTKK